MSDPQLPTREECDRFNNRTGPPPSWWWDRSSPSERTWPGALAQLALFGLGLALCALGSRVL